MVLVCLPSDALSQHLPSYLVFSYLWHGLSLHGCSSKAQPLLLTLDEGYLLTAASSGTSKGAQDEWLGVQEQQRNPKVGSKVEATCLGKLLCELNQSQGRMPARAISKLRGEDKGLWDGAKRHPVHETSRLSSGWLHESPKALERGWGWR